MAIVTNCRKKTFFFTLFVMSVNFGKHCSTITVVHLDTSDLMNAVFKRENTFFYFLPKPPSFVIVIAKSVGALIVAAAWMKRDYTPDCSRQERKRQPRN